MVAGGRGWRDSTFVFSLENNIVLMCLNRLELNVSSSFCLFYFGVTSIYHAHQSFKGTLVNYCPVLGYQSLHVEMNIASDFMLTGSEINC